MIFSLVSSISTGFKIRHYSRQVFAITRNFIGLHIKSQVSASKTPLRTKRSGVRIPCSAPKTVEPVRVQRLFFSLSGIRRTNGTEQRSGGALWPWATKRPQACESNPLQRAKDRWTRQGSAVFLFSVRDSKDERYRATLRWSVVTVSDQTPAGVQIESLAARQ